MSRYSKYVNRRGGNFSPLSEGGYLSTKQAVSPTPPINRCAKRKAGKLQYQFNPTNNCQFSNSGVTPWGSKKVLPCILTGGVSTRCSKCSQVLTVPSEPPNPGFTGVTLYWSSAAQIQRRSWTRQTLAGRGMCSTLAVVVGNSRRTVTNHKNASLVHKSTWTFWRQLQRSSLRLALAYLFMWSLCFFFYWSS